MSHLCFPPTILAQHLVVLGKTGAGKSSALRHIVEYLLDHKKRICIIDPKGDWNGLKVAADGKKPGYPVILFGNFKETAGRSIPADVPLNELAGKHIAELVTSGNRPCVVGFRGWTQGSMHRFWIDFAATLFNSNEGELYLVIDEVHNFAPKGKILSPDVGMCLHWSNRIMNEGRGIGLVNLIASQRPQKVHNDTLTACETLVAMRVVHKSDRDAVEDWIKGCGDPKEGQRVLSSLAGMPRGEAFVWSPEASFGPTHLTFPMFTTFDSFAPPQLQKKVSGKDWSTVDLEEVRTKLAAVIEKAKQHDPKELQKKIAELNKTIVDLKRQVASGPVAVDEKRLQREVDVVERQAKQIFDKTVREYESALAHLRGRLSKISSIANLADDPISSGGAPTPKMPPLTRGNASHQNRAALSTAASGSATTSGQFTSQEEGLVPAPAPTAPRSRPSRPDSSADSGDLPRAGRALLVALAQHPDGLTKRQILVFAGYRSSGDISKLFALFLREGFAIQSGDRLVITDAGLDKLGHFDPLPKGRDLRDRILQTASGPAERAILAALFEVYPDSIAKSALLERAGYKSSGDISKLFAQWALIGYATKVGNGQLRAADDLFAE